MSDYKRKPREQTIDSNYDFDKDVDKDDGEISNIFRIKEFIDFRNLNIYKGTSENFNNFERFKSSPLKNLFHPNSDKEPFQALTDLRIWGRKRSIVYSVY